jgi:hypothetical protein
MQGSAPQGVSRHRVSVESVGLGLSLHNEHELPVTHLYDSRVAVEAYDVLGRPYTKRVGA